MYFIWLQVLGRRPAESLAEIAAELTAGPACCPPTAPGRCSATCILTCAGPGTRSRWPTPTRARRASRYARTRRRSAHAERIQLTARVAEPRPRVRKPRCCTLRAGPRPCGKAAGTRPRRASSKSCLDGRGPGCSTRCARQPPPARWPCASASPPVPSLSTWPCCTAAAWSIGNAAAAGCYTRLPNWGWPAAAVGLVRAVVYSGYGIVPELTHVPDPACPADGGGHRGRREWGVAVGLACLAGHGQAQAARPAGHQHLHC